jgi:hypothetical protein
MHPNKQNRSQGAQQNTKHAQETFLENIFWTHKASAYNYKKLMSVRVSELNKNY